MIKAVTAELTKLLDDQLPAKRRVIGKAADPRANRDTTHDVPAEQLRGLCGEAGAPDLERMIAALAAFPMP